MTTLPRSVVGYYRTRKISVEPKETLEILAFIVADADSMKKGITVSAEERTIIF